MTDAERELFKKAPKTAQLLLKSSKQQARKEQRAQWWAQHGKKNPK